jgi:hypothetical protein
MKHRYQNIKVYARKEKVNFSDWYIFIPVGFFLGVFIINKFDAIVGFLKWQYDLQYVNLYVIIEGVTKLIKGVI